MDPLIFKTNIQSKQALSAIEEVLNIHPSIVRWNVDTEDIDKVLKVELAEVLTESEIIRIVERLGLSCEVLED